MYVQRSQRSILGIGIVLVNPQFWIHMEISTPLYHCVDTDLFRQGSVNATFWPHFTVMVWYSPCGLQRDGKVYLLIPPIVLMD